MATPPVMLYSPTPSYGSEESDTRTTPVEITKPPLKNTSRERRKAEKHILGRQIVDLERELSQLLAQRAVARCTTPSRVWRNLARRQLGRRAHAEDENQRLKARLLYQLQVAKTFESVLRNRANTLLENGEASERQQTKYPLHDLAALHDQCMSEIDDLYLQVDAMFGDLSQPHTFGEQPLRRANTVVEEEGGDKRLRVDLHDSAYAPFPYEKVCDATWRAITTEYVRQNRVIELFRCTDDEYTSKFTTPFAISPQAHDPRFSATMTMRKFKEEQRMVLVWNGLNIKETAAGSSIYNVESGWLVVNRAMDPVTGEPSEDGTVIRVFTRLTPTTELGQLGGGSLFGGQGSDATLHDHGAVANHLLMGTEADIASMTEAVENILLDEAIGSSDADLESVVGALEHALGC